MGDFFRARQAGRRMILLFLPLLLFSVFFPGTQVESDRPALRVLILGDEELGLAPHPDFIRELKAKIGKTAAETGSYSAK